ncbi:MAG: tetratricopeptide repeat protein [Chloroflexi bacterium]|nr:tetratricopeptide repeat protein [Chloroflexota bacterium]
MLPLLPAALALIAAVVACGLSKAETHYNAAVRLARQGNWSGAVAEYSEAVRVQPDFPSAYNNRGAAQAMLGNYAEAISDYGEAVRQDATYAEAYNNRGIAYSDLGEYDKAIADFDSAIARTSDKLASLAQEALAEHRAGLTEKLDPEQL